jgi:hypothetical protein
MAVKRQLIFSSAYSFSTAYWRSYFEGIRKLDYNISNKKNDVATAIGTYSAFPKFMHYDG